ncbi:uncharacterized protein LOC118404008 [Branchiostoma floridae]|uniref:Uncharacterized protein LOC118404008 n=1 Tax=Branchiostoma floridae TaxID=7739 RepID=A0A9J7HFQ7_BRAFL|nr:uncharacterized protein LOC118404008 [Branchiostoma floridae]
MEERHREILRAQLPYLRKDLRVKYVLPELKKEGIILPAMEEEIMAVPTFEEQVDMLVNLLETRGPHAFKAFVAVIEGTYRHLAEGLRQEDNMAIPVLQAALPQATAVEQLREENLAPVSNPSLMVPSPSAVFPEWQSMNPVEACFNVVVRNARHQWKEVSRMLGLSEPDIAALDKEHRGDTTECCRQALNLWVRDNGRAATPAALMEGLVAARFQNVADQVDETCMRPQEVASLRQTRGLKVQDDTPLAKRQKTGQLEIIVDVEGEIARLKVPFGSKGHTSLQQTLTMGGSVCAINVDAAVKKLETAYSGTVESVQEGCLLFSFIPSSKASLEKLWESYQSGELDQLFQKTLIQSSCKKAVQLKSFIRKEQYRICKLNAQDFTQCEGLVGQLYHHVKKTRLALGDRVSTTIQSLDLASTALPRFSYMLAPNIGQLVKEEHREKLGRLESRERQPLMLSSSWVEAWETPSEFSELGEDDATVPLSEVYSRSSGGAKESGYESLSSAAKGKGSRTVAGQTRRLSVQRVRKKSSDAKAETPLYSVFSWFQAAPKPVRQPTTRELFLLCRNLGAQWEQVGQQLGLDQDTLDRCALDNRDSQWGQVHDMLLTWMEEFEAEATVKKLTTALKAAEVGVNLYSFIRVPSALELCLLACELQSVRHWEQVLTQLGLTQDDISHAKTTHPDSKLKQIQTGLLNWREKYGVEATVDKLCEGLTSRNVDTTLFQFLKDPFEREQAYKFLGTPAEQPPSIYNLLCVADRLGPEWEGTAIQLGVNTKEVEESMHTKPASPTGLAFAALLMWKDAAGEEATMENLFEALRTQSKHLMLNLHTPFTTQIASVYQMGTLAGNLSLEECESVCLQLELMREELEICRESYRLDEHAQRVAILLKWLEKAGDQATLDALCESLHHQKVPMDKYHFLVDTFIPVTSRWQLEMLANNLSKQTCKDVSLRLGVTEEETETCLKMYPKDEQAQKAAMLLKWHKKAGEMATLDKLCEGLYQEGVPVDKYCFIHVSPESLVSVWQLGTLANKLERRLCEAVCLRLGLTKAEVQACYHRFKRDEHAKKAAMLLLWLDKSGNQASIGKLCESLYHEGVTVDNYRFIFDTTARLSTQTELKRLALNLTSDPYASRVVEALGFLKQDMEDLQKKYPGNTFEQIDAMLFQWQKKSGHEATAFRLCQVLHQVGIGPDKYHHLCYEQPLLMDWI